MHSIGIFCGSLLGNDETIINAAAELGSKLLAHAAASTIEHLERS